MVSFLSHYFTLSQAREVYTAVWGYPQDPGNWNEWARSNLQSTAYRPATAAHVQEAAQALIDDPRWHDLSGLNASATQQMVLALRRSAWIGTSVAALGMAAGFIPAAAIGGLATILAYQAVKPRGKKSPWAERIVTDEDLHGSTGKPLKLDNVYSPRPTWEQAGDTNSTPPPSRRRRTR